ncbi:IS5 family transposase [Actinocrinis puniceicyclus]|uniref:IS5 family transposase n=1 Tax=Actinocrinis puniceicyclus TaxID=977794 RepID=A0A8J8BFI1_9ACTN|nr:IS5 family transposase [Actinocrinis puniceicyclus]MBS2966670.1 IS5 family transposase [Actinocrinis puniceicyclus]
MTDAEWAILEPLLPTPACTTAGGGHPERYCRREIVDALRYLVDQGCKWRGLPRDFAPWKRVYAYFQRWEKAQVTEQVVDELRRRVRVAVGRDPEPSAAIVDSQSVRAAATVGVGSRGWDQAKKVTGRKRHIAVDTLGLLICVVAGPANVQDRDAARVLFALLRLVCPTVRLVWADGGYAGELVKTAKRYWSLAVEIVKRCDAATGFVVLPRRWVVERSFAHLANARRTVRDYERFEETHEAMVRWAAIRMMTRLAAQHAA